MEIINLLVQAISGALGGNLIGEGFDARSGRVAGNTLLGVIGGVLGGQLMNLLGIGDGTFDVLTLLANVASGGLSGGLASFVVVAIRELRSERSTR